MKEKNLIKYTSFLKIDSRKVLYYILEDGTKLIHYSISNYFKVGCNLQQTVIYNPNVTEPIQTYTINEVVDSLRPKFLKHFAQLYLDGIVEENIYITNTISEPQVEYTKERKLSEFDNNILKAMKFNPKERKE